MFIIYIRYRSKLPVVHASKYTDTYCPVSRNRVCDIVSGISLDRYRYCSQEGAQVFFYFSLRDWVMRLYLIVVAGQVHFRSLEVCGGPDQQLHRRPA
jgi:hypothetical protein